MPTPSPPADTAVTERGHLVGHGLTLEFGALRALNGVSLEVKPGSITGLIGPNGSGKTSLINVLSGLQAAETSGIWLDDARIDGLSAYRRARCGVARTFQAGRLFDSLSVIDNVVLGASRLFRSSLFGSALWTRRARREWRQQRQRACDILSIFGDRLLPRLDHQVATLSYANRRRVEIARALLSKPSIVLLDEPTAGMNPHETWELAEQLPQLMRTCSCSALLIEHKIDVISDLCPTVYVLDHGECLAVGPPETVKTNPQVAEAFLGVE